MNTEVPTDQDRAKMEMFSLEQMMQRKNLVNNSSDLVTIAHLAVDLTEGEDNPWFIIFGLQGGPVVALQRMFTEGNINFEFPRRSDQVSWKTIESLAQALQGLIEPGPETLS